MATNLHATPTPPSPKCRMAYPLSAAHRMQNKKPLQSKIFKPLQLKQGESGADAEAEGEAVEAAAGVYVEGLAVLHNVQT